MKKILLTIITGSLLIPSAFATISYDQTITYINGSGNPNTGWTADNEANGIQLGLRADVRDNGDTPNDGAGTYTFPTGNSVSNPNRADWNYQFTINSDINGVNPLNTYTFWLVISGTGLATPVTVNALGNGLFVDDSFGNNSSTQGNISGIGNGVNNAALAGANNVAANSETISFAPFLSLNNPDGTYQFELYATATDDPNADKLADVGITVNVGSGAPVPEPSTYLAGVMMLLPFGAGAVRFLRKQRTA
jgi:hypothetical protein